MTYLASPYSHSQPDIQTQRYWTAVHACGVLLSKNIHVFSPIVHCHPIALGKDLPTDAEFWKEYNMNFLVACSSLTVIDIPGWRESLGVQWELSIAEARNIPVHYFSQDHQLPCPTPS